MSSERGREVGLQLAYRVAMRLLGTLLLGTAVLAAVWVTRVIVEMARSPSGSGPLITMAPSGWMVALILGAAGLAVIGGLAALGAGALLLKRWAAWTALVLGAIALAAVLAFQGLLLLMGEPTNLLMASAGPTAAVGLAAVGLGLSRRGTAVRS